MNSILLLTFFSVFAFGPAAHAGKSGKRGKKAQMMRHFHRSMTAPPTGPSMKKYLSARIVDFGVTQFGVGQIEIDLRKAKLARKLEIRVEQLAAYLREHPEHLDKLMRSKLAEAVVGPNHKLYLVDRHHWLTLLHQLGVERVYYEIYPSEDFTKLSTQEFYQRLIELGLANPYDEDGQMLNPDLLAELHIGHLANFNWRGLVGIIRDEGLIRKIDIPHFEAAWVRPLKRAIVERYGPPDFSTSEGIQSAIARAAEFATSDEARDLPGFIPPCEDVLEP